MSSAPSRSRPDRLDAALAGATECLVGAVAACAVVNPVVLIDGRSGAGKTSLARRLREAWPLPTPAATLALDDVYPGWEGLQEGAEIVRADVLEPLRAGRTATWRRWDWDVSGWAEVHAVDPAAGLIVEGAGILTARSAPLADLRVWVQAPDAERRARALARDGDTYLPHWDSWASQEDRHIAVDAPATLADIVIDLP